MHIMIAYKEVEANPAKNRSSFGGVSFHYTFPLNKYSLKKRQFDTPAAKISLKIGLRCLFKLKISNGEITPKLDDLL